MAGIREPRGNTRRQGEGNGCFTTVSAAWKRFGGGHRIHRFRKQRRNGPYERTADAAFDAANKTPADKLAFSDGLQDLRSASFEDLDDEAATEYLRGIEGSGFFGTVRGNAVVALYNDQEVWDILGYEGPSFDQGGYVNRGFNDLDWLPEPRITEYGETQ